MGKLKGCICSETVSRDNKRRSILSPKGCCCVPAKCRKIFRVEGQKLYVSIWKGLHRRWCAVWTCALTTERSLLQAGLHVCWMQPELQSDIVQLRPGTKVLHISFTFINTQTPDLQHYHFALLACTGPADSSLHRALTSELCWTLNQHTQAAIPTARAVCFEGQSQTTTPHCSSSLTTGPGYQRPPSLGETRADDAALCLLSERLLYWLLSGCTNNVLTLHHNENRSKAQSRHRAPSVRLMPVSDHVFPKELHKAKHTFLPYSIMY